MILCVDIDGTLADNRWRKDRADTNLDAYFKALVDDPPIPVMISLVKALHQQGHYIVVVTSRPEKYRALTRGWLVQHDVVIDLLCMRPNGDTRPSAEVKQDMIKGVLWTYQHLPDTARRILIIDDKTSVIDKFKTLGYNTSQFTMGEEVNAMPALRY